MTVQFDIPPEPMKTPLKRYEGRKRASIHYFLWRAGSHLSEALNHWKLFCKDRDWKLGDEWSRKWCRSTTICGGRAGTYRRLSPVTRCCTLCWRLTHRLAASPLCKIHSQQCLCILILYMLQVGCNLWTCYCSAVWGSYSTADPAHVRAKNGILHRYYCIGITLKLCNVLTCSAFPSVHCIFLCWIFLVASFLHCIFLRCIFHC